MQLKVEGKTVDDDLATQAQQVLPSTAHAVPDTLPLT
jgi:hypothetical protein